MRHAVAPGGVDVVLVRSATLTRSTEARPMSHSCVRQIVAEHRLQLVLIAALAGADLAAIAPRGAEADAVRLDQGDGIAQLRPGAARPKGRYSRRRRRRHRRGSSPRSSGNGSSGVAVAAYQLSGYCAGPVVGVKQVHTFSSRCSRSHGLMTCKKPWFSTRFHRGVDAAEMRVQHLVHRRRLVEQIQRLAQIARGCRLGVIGVALEFRARASLPSTRPR